MGRRKPGILSGRCSREKKVLDHCQSVSEQRIVVISWHSPPAAGMVSNDTNANYTTSYLPRSDQRAGLCGRSGGSQCCVWKQANQKVQLQRFDPKEQGLHAFDGSKGTWQTVAATGDVRLWCKSRTQNAWKMVPPEMKITQVCIFSLRLFGTLVSPYASQSNMPACMFAALASLKYLARSCCDKTRSCWKVATCFWLWLGAGCLGQATAKVEKPPSLPTPQRNKIHLYPREN